METLTAIARSTVEGALVMLIVAVGFGMIVAGPRGAKWVLRTAFTPVVRILEQRLASLLYICGFTVASYYLGSIF